MSGKGDEQQEKNIEMPNIAELVRKESAIRESKHA